MSHTLGIHKRCGSAAGPEGFATRSRCLLMAAATLIVGAWMALMAGCGSTDSGAKSDNIPARFQPLAQAVEQDLASSGVPGVAIAIVEKGEVSFAHGFGKKDPGKPDPVKPTTLFRIGSLTKSLTAIALLQTVQAGLVDLDQPVVDYIPGFYLMRTQNYVPDITIRHLLTHTSGLFDYTENDAPANEKTDDALENFFTGRFADLGYVQSTPGAFFAYANPNFMLAGLVAQKVMGTNYRQLMRDKVFQVLGMNRTVFLASEVLADGDYANGMTSGGVVYPDSYDNPWARPAGYAWSTVLDMAKLAAFLVHGQDNVLANNLLTEMTSPQVPDPAQAGQGSYGFGMGVGKGISLSGSYYALKTLGHNGAISGYSSLLSCIPERDFCFIYLTNADQGQVAFYNSIGVAVQTLVDLPAPTSKPDVSPRPDLYPSYVGTFVDPFALGKIEITTDGSKLSIQVEYLDSNNVPYSHELQPKILNEFTMTVNGEDTPVTFIVDSEGKYMYIYSRPYVGVRQ